MSFVTCHVKHTLASTVICYLKKCWKKKCSTQVSLQKYYLKHAIMWSKETTRYSCSSFLLSFKILFPEIQSNIIWKRSWLCTSVNNFIYLFLWSWAGGILKILQSYWFRERAVFSFLLTAGMVTNYAKLSAELRIERAKFQNMTKTKMKQKQNRWQKHYFSSFS